MGELAANAQITFTRSVAYQLKALKLAVGGGIEKTVAVVKALRRQMDKISISDTQLMSTTVPLFSTVLLDLDVNINGRLTIISTRQ